MPIAFSQTMPTTLTFENMVKVVVLFTGRYKKILTGDYDFMKLLFCSIAQYEHAMRIDTEHREKVASATDELPAEKETHEPSSSDNAPEVDEKTGFWDKKFAQFDKFTDNLLKSDKEKRPLDGSSASINSADDEILAANLDEIDSWFDLDLIKSYDGINIDELKVSPTSLYHLFILLMAIAPLQAQESLSTYVAHFEEPMLSKYKRIAKTMTRSFSPQWTLKDCQDAEYLQTHGISYSRFFNVVKSVMPFAFDGFGVLFEHFLFNRRTAPDTPKPPSIHDENEILAGPPVNHPYTFMNDHDGLEELDEFGEERKELPAHLRPRLPEPTKLMNAGMIGQLATFMNTNSFQLYGGLRKLYAGSEAGFSMGSFEQKVFKWNAPTIILIQGYMMDPNGRGARDRAFLDQIPPVRYSNSCAMVKQHNGELVFGAVINTPWKNSNKSTCSNITFLCSITLTLYLCSMLWGQFDCTVSIRASTGCIQGALI